MVSGLCSLGMPAPRCVKVVRTLKGVEGFPGKQLLVGSLFLRILW